MKAVATTAQTQPGVVELFSSGVTATTTPVELILYWAKKERIVSGASGATSDEFVPRDQKKKEWNYTGHYAIKNNVRARLSLLIAFAAFDKLDGDLNI